MSKTSSLPELLQVCLWDLQAGCGAMVDRLPAIAHATSNADLGTQLERCVSATGMRGRRLRDAGKMDEGPENLWMRGILDDAERDTRSIEPGRLLDLAVIGAIRKALVAEIASIATATAIAASLADAAVLSALEANDEDARAQDARLRELLSALA